MYGKVAELCAVIYNPHMMGDISKQLAIRDGYRRKMTLRKTPEQRMRDMADLQKTAWETLRRSPEGYAHFLRRNYKARAIPVPKLNG